MPSPRSTFPALGLMALLAVPCAAQSGSFGNAVLIHEGELIVAEPNNWFRPGLVYVYEKEGGAWRETARLIAPDAERADGFGAALAAAGSTLFVAQRGGQIHVFRREGGAWRAAGTLDAAEVDGLDPGCNQYGYCGTDFGLSLAATDGWLLVGKPGSPGERPGRDRRGRAGGDEEPAPPGVVHVFRRSEDGAWTAAGRLRPSAGRPGDRFGAAVAVEGGRR